MATQAPESKPVKSTNNSVTRVAASITTVTLIAANAKRTTLTIYNDSTAILYISGGTTVSSTDFSVKLDSQDYFEFPSPVCQDAILGIWSAANGAAQVTECQTLTT